MNTSFNPWSSLELLPGLNAVSAVWQKLLGPDFEIFRSAFLQSRQQYAQSFPCRKCGCAHQVAPPFSLLPSPPSHPVAVCQCDPCNCDDLVLTPDDVLIWQLHWPKLARALCEALGCRNSANSAPFDSEKSSALGLPNTIQFGAWSIESVPVLLTIQSEDRLFRNVLSELAARLRRSFIIFAPSNRHLDVAAQELLANAGAGFFALDENVRLTSRGTLQAAKTPGELFAAFTPKPQEPPDEDAARRAFALVQQLDTDTPSKPPSTLTVFRLYCIEELSIPRIARKCGCSVGTVANRLALLRAKTGVAPESLRRLSGHISKMEEDLSDSRAKRLHRRSFIYDEMETEQV